MLAKIFGKSGTASGTPESLNELGDEAAAEERFYGFYNLGNSCYFNSGLASFHAQWLKPYLR